MAEFLVDSSIASPHGIGGGYKARDFNADPEGSMPYCAPATFPLIPRSEWADRIREMERDKSRLSDITTQAGVPCIYQDWTNFCHGFSAVQAIMAVRAAQGQPFVLLSGSSVAAPAVGFINEGQWIREDMRQIAEVGAASVDFVPMIQVSQDGFKPGWEQDAAKYRCTEFWDLGRKDSQMFARIMTLLLSRTPVFVGLNWWKHAVCFFDPVILQNGGFGVRFRNSWPNFGDDGYALLDEAHATADEAYSPRSVTVSP